MGLIPQLVGVSVPQKRAAFLIPLSRCHNPARITESWTMLWVRTALSEFFLQGPISAFIGTFRIGAKYEDVPFAVNLGFGTR
jgi:hypothetical protein